MIIGSILIFFSVLAAILAVAMCKRDQQAARLSQLIDADRQKRDLDFYKNWEQLSGYRHPKDPRNNANRRISHSA